MMQQQQKVKEWMQLFGQETPDKPVMPADKIRELRLKLIVEETDELDWATDLPLVADALADLLYVVLGTAVAYGIDLEPVFDEVHRSNMSKLWTHAELMQVNVAGKGLHYKHVGNDLYIAKEDSGKVIKPPGYSPANIKPLIEEQMQ